MTDTRSVPTGSAAAYAGQDPLARLVSRIAAGERSAFRLLYAFLALPMWHAAAERLSDPPDALAVTRATFLEISHLARYHDPYHEDARNWIASIAEGRADARCRAESDPFASVYDNHVHLQLAHLLGPGRATVRIGRGAFVSVSDLDAMLTTVAAAWEAANASDAPDSPAA